MGRALLFTALLAAVSACSGVESGAPTIDAGDAMVVDAPRVDAKAPIDSAEDADTGGCFTDESTEGCSSTCLVYGREISLARKCDLGSKVIGCHVFATFSAVTECAVEKSTGRIFIFGANYGVGRAYPSYRVCTDQEWKDAAEFEGIPCP